MAKITKSVNVRVPVDKTFVFLADWRNIAKFHRAVYDWKPTTEQTQGNGARFAYKVRGLIGSIQYETEVSEYAENCGWKLTTIKGPKATERYALEPIEGGTRVTYSIDYDAPVPVIGGLIDALMARAMRKKRVKRYLNKLRTRLEARPSDVRFELNEEETT
jgi:tRNA(Phe) wybutosine-synthesizing methylase Tyw3